MTVASYTPTLEVPTSAITVKAHRGGAELVDRLADEWRELCARAVDAQPFYRPEWIRAYLRAFAPNATTLIVEARLDGRLVLLLPLIEETATFSKVPVRRLRAPVNFCAGRFDATCSAGPEGAAAVRAAWNHLKQAGGWDLLYFRDALEGSVVSQLATLAQEEGCSAIAIPDQPSPYVPIPADSEALKQMPINARLRRELRAVRRQLEGRSLNFYRLDQADRPELERFYRLEASGWKGQQNSAIVSMQTQPFFSEIAEAAARFGYFTLYMLELDGELIAGHFGFTQRECYYSVIVTYNESYREISPGHLIVSEIVSDCAARGLRCFDVTGQTQEWKLRWTKQARPLSHYFIFRGPLGRLAHTVGTKFGPIVGRLWEKKAKTA